MERSRQGSCTSTHKYFCCCFTRLIFHCCESYFYFQIQAAPKDIWFSWRLLNLLSAIVLNYKFCWWSTCLLSYSSFTFDFVKPSHYLTHNKEHSTFFTSWDTPLTQWRWWERGGWWWSCLLSWTTSPTLCRTPSQHWAAPSSADGSTSVWRRGIAGRSFLLQ